MFRKLNMYLTHNSALNIELFKILGVGGVGISFIASIYCLLTFDIFSAGINCSAGILAIFLLYYVEKTGHYMTGYIIVDLAVFMLLFAILFFTGSGMDGSMPYFFSFGLMFTFLMFEGKILVIMESLLSVFYLAVCIFAIRFPQYVKDSGSSLSMKSERIVGVFLPAFSMGMIFLLYIREYKKQKRIAEEANRAKSIFLANMSHEIRTPINAVLGFNEVILRTSKDDSTKEYAGYIAQSGHRLLKVINEILDFSKIESGKDELMFETFSLRDLADEMESMMSILAQNKSLDYKLDYDENIHEVVLSDREKLVRILTNLLSNAFKYTHGGSVTLHIRLKDATEHSQKVYFAVEDTGIGIKISEVNNLFHAYERADLMKNRKIEGTGLGLAITEQLLHMLGSSVCVESTYKKGSTFSFELLLSVADSADVDTEENTQISFTAPETRILVVDDDEMNLRMMNSLLEIFQISADFVESGEECLVKLKTNCYHLILMDYMMPGMDGAVTMERIRAKEKETSDHTPIVVLTADVVDHIDQRLKKRGFDDYLSKPIDLTELGRTILQYIPEDMVIRDCSPEHVSIASQKYEICAEFLQEKGISLEEGIKLVNGDFSQYMRIAEFFVQHARPDMDELQSAADEEDLARLRISLHSLKGKAGSVGAHELRTLAENLENRCRHEDLEYVLCSLDLILLQWKRCAEGLRRLLDTEQNLKATGQYEGYMMEDLMEELRRTLGLCEGKKAKSVVEQMKKSVEEHNILQLLDEIEGLIDEMEFEVAIHKIEDELVSML